MKPTELHQQILKKLDDLDKKVDDVRTKDVPELKTAVSGFRTELETMKKSQTWSTRLYTVLGGAIAVAISKFTGHP